MNSLQIELTRLIGKKDLTFGCVFQGECMNDWNEYVMLFDSTHKTIINGIEDSFGRKFINIEIIGHTATLSDFHRWMNSHTNGFGQTSEFDYDEIRPMNQNIKIKYDSSKDLVDQDEETLIQIIALIKSK